MATRRQRGAAAAAAPPPASRGAHTLSFEILVGDVRPGPAVPAGKAAAGAGRPDARKRRTPAAVSGRVSSPGADRQEAVVVHANAAMASKNATAPAHPAMAPAPARAAPKPARRALAKAAPRPQQAVMARGASSGENGNPSEGAGTGASTWADTMKSLLKRVIVAEELLAIALEQREESNSLIKTTAAKLDQAHEVIDSLVIIIHQLQSEKGQNEAEVHKVTEQNARLCAMVDEKVSEVQNVTEENVRLCSMVDKKESEVQKTMEENVRLLHIVDKKEAQLNAVREQCKILVLFTPTKAMNLRWLHLSD
ncbi:hypothetical protein ACP70R_003533 [Stipagrostis hirtigluma subsp. patula]